MGKFTALEQQLQAMRAEQERMHRRIRALEEELSRLHRTDDTQPMTRVPEGVSVRRSSGRA